MGSPDPHHPSLPTLRGHPRETPHQEPNPLPRETAHQEPNPLPRGPPTCVQGDVSRTYDLKLQARQEGSPLGVERVVRARGWGGLDREEWGFLDRAVGN